MRPLWAAIGGVGGLRQGLLIGDRWHMMLQKPLRLPDYQQGSSGWRGSFVLSRGDMLGIEYAIALT